MTFIARNIPRTLILICSVCHETKSGDGNFRKNGNSKTGYEHRCKQCLEGLRITAEHYRQERERRRKQLLKGFQGLEDNVKKFKPAGRRLLLSNMLLPPRNSSEIQVIYTLTDPRTNAVRYVGRTCDPERRYKQHIDRSAKTIPIEKSNWVLELRALNLRPSMVIIENVEPTNKVFERERRWIFHFIQHGATLINWESRKFPYLVKKLKETTANLLTEPTLSEIWYPLHCAEQLDLDNIRGGQQQQHASILTQLASRR